MTRLIDASELIQLLCVNMDSGVQFGKATHCVDVMPTVDAVPVVRCKDCKYYKTESYQEGRYVFTFCERDRERLIFDMNGDDYCSRAERKEHETD